MVSLKKIVRRLSKASLLILVIGIVFVASVNLFSHSAKADDQAITNAKSTCNVGFGVGWMICPLVLALSKTADGFNGILNGFFTIDDTSGNGINGQVVHNSINAFTTIADLVLVIVFLIIIYSEATGNGFGSLSNYSVKNTLPRLIIFAIVINLSFYICVAAIDLSNIVGSSIPNLMSQTLDPNKNADTIPTNTSTWAANVLQSSDGTGQ